MKLLTLFRQDPAALSPDPFEYTNCYNSKREDMQQLAWKMSKEKKLPNPYFLGQKILGARFESYPSTILRSTFLQEKP